MSDNLLERLNDLAADKINLRSENMALKAKLSESEALLAKAVEALGEAIYLLDPDDGDIAKETGLHRIVTTYAELTGGKDE